MTLRHRIAIGMALFLVFTGVGCQQLVEGDQNANEELTNNSPEQLEPYRRQADWNIYESKEDGFAVEHPVNTEVVVQSDGLYYLYEKMGEDDTPPPDLKFQLRTISTSEYIQELFDSGPRPENIILDLVSGGREQINLVKYFPEKGNSEYFCPSYIIEAEPRSVIVSPWECSDIDYIQEVVKSFHFSK